MLKNHWLNNIKVGDTVVVCGSGVTGRSTIGRVDKLTPTQLTVGKMRFMRRGGRQIGAGKWSFSYLMQPTPELLERVELETRRRDAKSALEAALRTIDTLPLEKLAAIQEFLEDIQED